MRTKHPVLPSLSVLASLVLLTACMGDGVKTTSGTGTWTQTSTGTPTGAGATGGTGGTGGVAAGTGGATGGTGGVAPGTGGTGGVAPGTGGAPPAGTGGVAPGTGGTGGAGLPAGACINPQDAPLLSDPDRDIGAAVVKCGQQNLGAEPGTLSCILAIGVTQECAQCMDDLVHCTIIHCINPCLIDATGQACLSCRANQCDPAFEACSGLQVESPNP